MKPTKNHVYCPACREFKMQFETEKEAYCFIEYEAKIIFEENGYCPIRAYKCPKCMRWHLTSEYLAEDDSYYCCVEKDQMETARKLLGLSIRNTQTVAINLSKKIEKLSKLLKTKEVDWGTARLLAQEVIDIFEKVWATPYRYVYNVRKLMNDFTELCHLYTWRMNQIAA